ncbi:uroporphyrinogen-III C-methyltransferase [Curvibacter sp. CHRR-16]|uniref:uroporphyrinogen-III C-methyltransferase n=1 Tax=Curvibacter sp. CHRR-16 TaxID=2835872 RepID=UPI001BDADA2D|nr:uroporphyrinogen-III C-methyltransferase [Curvibacter sp. CHRR-16]MBT0571384.1 uroporphyrinogen-III C-methyltransferase [Curvibacter sp. CHRR-16]
MSTSPDESPAVTSPAQAAAPASPPAAPEVPRRKRLQVIRSVRPSTWMTLGVVASLGLGVGLWAKIGAWQTQWQQQTTAALEQASQARLQAKQAQDMVLDTASKLALAESRLAEAALQRSQLEELMQSLSRSRDENLVVDIEAAVRFAMQQAQLTGSVDPLVASLQSAAQRLNRLSQPRLAPVQRAVAKDLDQIRSANYADLPTLLVKLDELVLLVDELPVANALAASANTANATNAAPATTAKSAKGARAAASAEFPSSQWWQGVWQELQGQLQALVRVSRIDAPEAALLAPEQAYFVRENLKLRLLNARLGLLSRQNEVVRTDLALAATMLQRYFDANARKSQLARDALQQLQAQARTLQLPRVDNTLAALATAAAGR